MADLEASNREILERYPPEVMVKRIGWRLEKQAASARSAPRRWSLPRLAPAAGLAVLLLAAGAVLVTMAPWRDSGELTRLKGARSHLVIYRQTAAGAEALARAAASARGRAADRLRAASSRYGVISRSTGAGCHPALSSQSAVLQPVVRPGRRC
jgi:hypothetical protein